MKTLFTEEEEQRLLDELKRDRDREARMEEEYERNQQRKEFDFERDQGAKP